MSSVRPFVVDNALTAIAIGFRNPAVNMIADRLLPRISVGGEKFKWLQYNLADGFTVPNTFVGRKGVVNQVEMTATEQTDSVDDYGLDDVIPNTDIDAAAQLRAQGLSVYDPEAAAMPWLIDLMLLDREIRVANRVFAATTYPVSRRLTLSGTAQFSDTVNSSPITTINNALDGTLVVRPNTMVLSRPGWTALRSHPHIVNAVKGGSTGRGNASLDEVRELFELSQILVGEAFVNTARKGQNPVMARVWGKHMALLHLNTVAGPQGGVTFGYTAEFGTRLAGRIQEPNVGIAGGQKIRVGERVKEIIAAPDAGFFLENIIA